MANECATAVSMKAANQAAFDDLLDRLVSHPADRDAGVLTRTQKFVRNTYRGIAKSEARQMQYLQSKDEAETELWRQLQKCVSMCVCTNNKVSFTRECLTAVSTLRKDAQVQNTFVLLRQCLTKVRSQAMIEVLIESANPAKRRKTAAQAQRNWDSWMLLQDVPAWIDGQLQNFEVA
jgi:hypothetical protein